MADAEKLATESSSPKVMTLEKARDFLKSLVKRRQQEEKARRVLRVEQGGNSNPVLLAGEVAILYGEAKVGKSRAAVALLGWPEESAAGDAQQGQAASLQGDVKRCQAWYVEPPKRLRYYLYHATETRYVHLQRYAEALGAGEISEDNFLPFTTEEELKKALKAIQAVAKNEDKPALAVVDSLIKLVPPHQSENEAKAMDTVMAKLKHALSSPGEEPLVALAVIHHATKGNGGPRGSGAIAANADHILRLEPQQRDEENWGILVYEKGRGDVWQEVEDILWVQVRGRRRSGSASRGKGPKPEKTSKASKANYIEKVRERFREQVFTEEELIDFLKSVGCPEDRARRNVSTWKSKKRIASEDGMLKVKPHKRGS